MRIAKVERDCTLNLMNLFIRKIDAESIDVALQMLDLTSSHDWKNVWSLKVLVCFSEVQKWKCKSPLNCFAAKKLGVLFGLDRGNAFLAL